MSVFSVMSVMSAEQLYALLLLLFPKGFRDEYRLGDQTQYVDYSSRDVQAAITPAQVLQILKDGNERFRNGQRRTCPRGQVRRWLA